jgi:CRP-like cAMP-binding protein
MINAVDLHKYSLFGGLTTEQIERIRPLLTYESYAPDEIIIHEDDRNDKIRFILEGKVAVIKKGKVLSELGEGDTFGEMEVLDVMPSAATIKALVSTNVATISNRTLRDIYKMDIHIFSMMIMNLARDLSRRLRRMDDLACQDM